MSMDSKGAKMA